MNFNRYCYNLNGLCDDERCYCTQEFEAMHKRAKRRVIYNALMWTLLEVCGSYFILRIIISLIWKI